MGGNSIGPFWRGVLATYRDRLAADKQKGAPAALAYYDAVVAALAASSRSACRCYKEAPYLSGALAIPLKDAASAGKVGGVAGGAGQRGGVGVAARAARRHVVGRVDGEEGDRRQAEGAALPGEVEEEAGTAPRDAAKRLLGQTLDVYWAVADTRMLLTLGKDAKARLAAIAAGKARPSRTRRFAGGARRPRRWARSLLLRRSGAGAGRGRSLSGGAAAGRAGEGRRQPIPVVFTAGGDGAGKLWTHAT